MKNKLGLILIPLALACTGCGGSKSSKRVLKVEFMEGGFGLKPYQELAAGFMAEHPDVEVKLVPNALIDSDTATRIQNGTCADVVIYNRSVNNIRMWYEQGLVYDLTSVFEQQVDGVKLKERLDDNGLKISKYRDKYLTIPEYYNINGFVYNASMFDYFKWEIPTNTKEFEDLCAQILQTQLGGKQVKPLVYCQDADGYLYYADEGWNTIYNGVQNMDTFYKFESPEVYAPANNEGKIKALTLQKKYFFDSGYEILNSKTLSAKTAQSKLFTYEAAMMLNGSWFENEMADSLSDDISIKMFAIPEIANDKGEVIHAEGYTCPQGKKSVLNTECFTNMFIPTKAANTSDAIEYLKYTSTKKACEIWTKYSNAVRPLVYDYSPTNEAYSNMSSFGKSVLEIANDNYLYVPDSSADIAIIGKAGFRPQGYWFWQLDKYSPELCTQLDYDYAKNSWAAWVKEAEETFKK